MIVMKIVKNLDYIEDLIKMLISLGTDCSVSYQLQMNNLRLFSLPFDWIKSNNFNDVLKLLANNFEDLLLSDNYVIVKKSIKHPVINDLFINDTENESLVAKLKNSDIIFYHDFNTFDDKNFDEAINKVIDKYSRRICKLYSLLEKETNITFIRLDKISLDPKLVNDFFTWTTYNYPNLTTNLILILLTKRNDKDQEIKWLKIFEHNNHIRIIFHIKEVTDSWKLDQIDPSWNEIFNLKF